MRITPIWSLLGLVALGTGSLLAGCDGDETPPKSGEGESCDKTADCSDGLKCLEGACYKSGSDTNEGGSSGNVGPTPPARSGLGETCTRRSDCEDGLGCFNARCVDPAEGAGGGPATASLGGLGETCVLTSDCEKDLACQPPPNGLGAGVCTPLETGLMGTGKDCHAECLEASDCCELPVAYHSFYDGVFNFYGTGANSCAELTSLLDGVDCATTVIGAELARCFANDAFCGCAADTWSCSEMGTCVYDTGCSVNGSVPDGCPLYSRSGRPLSSVCSVDGICGAAAPTTCTTDASCVNKAVVDVGDTCVANECTCYQGSCYRQCDADLDCAKGRLCSEDKVCVLAPQCTSDSQCAVLTGDYRFTCNLDTNTCVKPCENDLDCNPGGLTGGLTMLCNADQMCEPLGCTENDDCPAASGGVKMFCSEKLVVTPGTNVSSAITD